MAAGDRVLLAPSSAPSPWMYLVVLPAAVELRHVLWATRATSATLFAVGSRRRCIPRLLRTGISAVHLGAAHIQRSIQLFVLVPE